MSLIHPTAVIDAKAELDSSVKVGPYTIIGPNVQIGAGSEIGPHTVIDGHTTIGENNKIFQFASLGAGQCAGRARLGRAAGHVGRRISGLRPLASSSWRVPRDLPQRRHAGTAARDCLGGMDRRSVKRTRPGGIR